MAGPERPLWTCPRCERSYASRNQSHACIDRTAEDYLETRGESARAVYRQVLSVLGQCGRFRVHAQKTRIAFISRMTFAGLTAGRRWVDLHLILPDPVDDPRVRKLTGYGPTSWGHSIRLSGPEDVDEMVASWLCEALRRGDQETLDPEATVAPLTPGSLEVFHAGFRGRVEESQSGPMVRLPRYLSQALAEVEATTVRVGKSTAVSPIAGSRGEARVMVPADSGRRPGDEVDIFIVPNPA